MKTSNIIILTIAVLFMALLTAAMFTLRNNVLTAVEIAERQSKYRAIPVEEFDRLDFADRWVVRVRRGRDYKVEVKPEEGASLQPDVARRNGTLYFTTGATAESDTAKAYAKITAPSLREIKAADGSRISLEGFQSDSLSVILEDGFFTGKENSFHHISFKTSGDSQVEMVDDPDK